MNGSPTRIGNPLHHKNLVDLSETGILLENTTISMVSRRKK